MRKPKRDAQIFREPSPLPKYAAAPIGTGNTIAINTLIDILEWSEGEIFTIQNIKKNFRPLRAAPNGTVSLKCN